MARELLDESGSDSDIGGASVDSVQLRINRDFAKRFEHNKKREELQKLEEKHGKHARKRKRDEADSESSHSESESSDSEDEDDVGELATAALDTEIMATLNAIRSKDPRVYDGQSTFYTKPQFDEPEKEKQDKPMYLRDYHRKNLLQGTNFEADQPMTYQQESQRVVNEFVAAADAVLSSEDDQDGGFLVTKRKEKAKTKPHMDVDVENADKDPETFLSNFMTSRAWVPTERSSFQPFESDDEEEEKRAEEFEEAYNFRFEDPAKSNEKLRTHARDMAAKYSVRREENTRRKKREEEKAKKALEKQHYKEEKSRLKKLRIEQVEEKVQKIKQAAGLKSSDLKPEDWSRFVDDDWNDVQWEAEMQRRFGDAYYAELDTISDDNGEAKRKPKKPKFDDDIDIKDLVPDFQVDDDAEFALSEEDKSGSRKKRQKLRGKDKHENRKDRRIIEQLVDDQLRFELDSSLPGASKATGFRYRETSPQSFGLTARDILLADDTQLNQFAGLKKLAAFRDDEKKQKDKKHLGKKARLRKWRQDTFGDEEGLQNIELVPAVVEATTVVERAETGGVDIRTAGKKKRRGKKRKTVSAA